VNPLNMFRVNRRLNFLSALVAEFRAGIQLRLTIRARGRTLLRAALHAELRARRVLVTTLRTRDACLRCALGGALAATLIRLLHRIIHRASHRIAERKPSAETNASAGATAGILRRIAHRIRRLKLRVTSDVANHAHRSALVHRGFDFLWQRDVFDDELRELESERL